MKNYKSWDLYSIAVIFLYLLLLINSEKIENNDVIKSYKTTLKNLLIQVQERPSIKNILKSVYEKYSSINKNLAKNIVNEYKKEFTNEKFKKRSQQLAQTVIQEVEKDNKRREHIK